jgi:hypothetical protein
LKSLRNINTYQDLPEQVDRRGNCACGLIKIQHGGTDSIWQQIKAASSSDANLTAKVTTWCEHFPNPASPTKDGKFEMTHQILFATDAFSCLSLYKSARSPQQRRPR